VTPIEIGALIIVVTLVVLFSGLPIAWGLTLVSVGFLLVFQGVAALANVPVLLVAAVAVHRTQGFFMDRGGGYELALVLLMAALAQACLGAGAFTLRR
jgi:uncharacterized membrane protein YphA (DoxX/SURF4 family)